ncbi:class I SAM-dependent methyltransferase [Labrenzia sp. VG12]|uniref:class I SAM-dependent methyltransferase n=1 Tax=Labrenzia sp. VG12 TaxID=2021862 RepID=UPI000B8C2C73|nr:class I SAM-dependent methyltransferase [Labrenzia sp. VG12]ASP32456.1 hypothetical protein CHH27_03710 [Labrenzia sp. VG12]
MLFDINKTNYKYREEFDEFPDIEKHTFEFTKCTCGGTEATVVSTVSRHRNFLPIVACETCGTLRANPYFTDETAAYYYRNVYGNVKRTDRSPQQLFREQRALSIVPFFSDVMEQFQTVLDYGGGAGGKTADFIEAGKELSLHEVENNYSQYAYENGIKPHAPSKRYDLVVVSHVIEHMIDPVKEMGEIIDSCCAPDGLLLVATPIIDRQRARQWLQHFHISHKYYFTEDALIGMMAGLGCTLVKQNNADSFLFRVGGTVDQEKVARHYRAGAAKTRAAIMRELKPGLKKVLSSLKFWRPQPHNQAAPRTPELSP